MIYKTKQATMKKILLILSVVSLLYSCTENDGTENADPLLSGITFYSSTDTMFPEREEVGKSPSYRYNYELVSFLDDFPLNYTEKTILQEAKVKVYKDTYIDTISSIKFTGDACIFSNMESKRIYDIYRREKIVNYIFSEGVFNIRGWIVEVDKDGIYSDHNDDLVIERSSAGLKKEFSLDNYKIEVERSWKEEIEKNDSISTTLSSEKYSFVRNENEVILSNENSKLYGKLNTTNMTFELTQIAPTKKNLGTFKLK